MGIWATLQDAQKRVLSTFDFGGKPHLVVVALAGIKTQFRDAVHTDAGTVSVVTPPGGGGIVLTDLLMSAEKVNTGSLTVQFTDGTNTVVIHKVITTDGPANVTMPFAGRWTGWKDARIDSVSTGSNIDANASVGYILIPPGADILDFSEWDKLRG